MWQASKFARSALSVGALVAAGLGSSVSLAAPLPDFQVTEGVVPGALTNTFTADKITGNYVEVITFGAGTFNVSLQWSAGQYVANDGTTAIGSQLGSITANQYQLYALYQGSGTFSTVGGVTTFTTNVGVGSLNVWIDPLSNTTFSAPGTGNTAWGTASIGDDMLLATGTPQAGTGTLDPSLPTCGGGGPINCGSFGTSSTFALTAFGSTYFTSPIPFFNISFQAGQLNDFTPTSTQTINGSMDVVFKAVPEPSTVALAGLALLGLSVSLRRKRS
jgi:hypothetical protein